MVTCTYCDKSYHTSSINRHLKNAHGVDKKQTYSIECCDCNLKFHYRNHWIKHLKITHNKEVEIIPLTFNTYEDFETWLEAEEKLLCVKFIRPRGEKTSKNGSIITLICSRGRKVHRSAADKNNRKRALKSQGSRRPYRVCTSHLIVNRLCLPEKKVCVKYTKTHYGHEKEVHPQQLSSKCDKDTIASEAQGDQFLVQNEKSGGVFLVKRENNRTCRDPILQCQNCKICRHNFSCSCCNFFLEKNTISKHTGIHFVSRNIECADLQDVDMELTQKNNETTDEDNVCESSVNNYSKSAEEELKHIYEEIGRELQNFNNLPINNKKQAVQFMKAALILMKMKPISFKTPLKTIAKGKRRKIQKQEAYRKTVQYNQSKKNTRKINTTVRQYDEETELLHVPRFDYIIDHEEVIG